VNGAGDQFLPGSGFAQDQRCRIGRRNLLGLLQHRSQLIGSPNDCFERCGSAPICSIETQTAREGCWFVHFNSRLRDACARLQTYMRHLWTPFSLLVTFSPRAGIRHSPLSRSVIILAMNYSYACAAAISSLVVKIQLACLEARHLAPARLANCY
jgi:hypothetical protein